MRRVAVKIAYLGDEFNGSQIQPTEDNPSIRTVAGEILKNLDARGYDVDIRLKSIQPLSLDKLGAEVKVIARDNLTVTVEKL